MLAMRKIIIVGLSVLLIIGFGGGLLILWLSSEMTVVPRESQIVNAPEIQPFLAGREGFRGIYWNLDTNEISFAFPTTLSTAKLYFEDVHSIAQANGWQLTHSSSLTRIYQRSEEQSYGTSKMTVIWQVNLSYDPKKSEVILSLEKPM